MLLLKQQQQHHAYRNKVEVMQNYPLMHQPNLNFYFALIDYYEPTLDVHLFPSVNSPSLVVVIAVWNSKKKDESTKKWVQTSWKHLN